jgi:hypothetical protein
MRKSNVVAALAALLFSAPWVAAVANTIAFNPDPKDVLQGSGNFGVNLVGTGFTSSTDGGGLTISFDPTILQAISVSLDATWNFFTATGTIDNTLGTITGIEFATSGTPAAAFTVGTITFAPKTNSVIGSSILGLSEYTTGATGGFAVGGSPQTVAFDNGLVNVNAVPAPGALWLLATGMAGLGFRRLRRG